MKSVLKIEAVRKKLRGRMTFFHELTHALDTYRTRARYARSLPAFVPVEKSWRRCEPLAEVLQERDHKRALREQHSRHPREKSDCLLRERQFKISPRGERRETSSPLRASVMPSACERENPLAYSFLTMPFVSITSVCIDGQCTI
jgi:hypothetical protein